MSFEYYFRWFKLICLRLLARFGFFLMNRSLPSHSFSKKIPTSASNERGEKFIEILFYVPKEYEARIKNGHKFPVTVNFHGGGFCMGLASDDARWSNIVVQETDSVVISVEYSLAPEFPFPTAVDEGVDVLLYLDWKGDSLGLDTRKITLSGFSAGGNLSLSVPMRLDQRLKLEGKSRYDDQAWKHSKIISIASFYPSIDKTITREEKKRNAIRPDKAMPTFLTSLFDPSYAKPEQRSSRFCSPGKATDEEIVECLPQDIQFILCEWDMLLKEGSDFAKRVERLGKNVKCEVVKQVVHAWDKLVKNPEDIEQVEALYREICQGIRASNNRE